MSLLREAYLLRSNVNIVLIEELVLGWSTCSEKNILSLETFETIYHQRLVELASECMSSSSYLLYNMLMQMHFLLFANPGIINLHQGSEFLEATPMGDIPTPLNIQSKVGSFANGNWITHGEFQWFYEYLKRCLWLRRELGLQANHEVHLVFHDEKVGLLVFEMETDVGLRLILLHPSSVPLIDEP